MTGFARPIGLQTVPPSVPPASLRVGRGRRSPVWGPPPFRRCPPRTRRDDIRGASPPAYASAGPTFMPTNQLPRQPPQLLLQPVPDLGRVHRLGGLIDGRISNVCDGSEWVPITETPSLPSGLRRSPYPRTAASMAATSIFRIVIIASNARLATSPPVAIASVSARGVICHEAPLVLAPAALALLPAVTDDRVPVPVGLGLVVGRHLERERLAVLEHRARRSARCTGCPAR